MHLHSARMSARQDGSGGLLLLEEQDRSRFDREEIARNALQRQAAERSTAVAVVLDPAASVV